MKKNIRPPRLADNLFEWYSERAAVEDLRGDLEELFYKELRSMSPRKAKQRYWRHVISLLFSYAIRRRKQHASFSPFSSANSFDMFRNYFKVASRSLARHKFFTIINVLGLAIGMSISLLLIAMFAYVSRYDNFHVNKDRIYRVISDVRDNVNNDQFASAPTPLANKLREELTGLEEVVRINSTLSGEAEYNKKQIPLRGYFADQNFFIVFTFPFRNGNPAEALSKPHTLVITEEAAKKMFAEADPVGKRSQ